MREIRGNAIAEFLSRLAEGDPVALGFVGFFVVVGIIAVLWIMKVKRDLRRDDEAWAKKHGRKRPK